VYLSVAHWVIQHILPMLLIPLAKGAISCWDLLWLVTSLPWKLHTLLMLGLSLLEYNCVVWSPQFISDIRALEKVQRRFIDAYHFCRDCPIQSPYWEAWIANSRAASSNNGSCYVLQNCFGLTCLEMSDFLPLVLFKLLEDIHINCLFPMQLSTLGSISSVFVLLNLGTAW